MKLSILIASLPSRIPNFLPRLLNRLQPQLLQANGVEVLIDIDNKDQTVGGKRNNLLERARGKYVTFIDDDDLVSEDYVSSIQSVYTEHPDVDCIVFDSLVTINGGIQQPCKYGIEYEYNGAAPPNLWLGKPAHTMVWRRDLIKNKFFPESDFGEDIKWVVQCWPLVQRQERINKTLYFYEFNSATSETRTNARG